MKLASIIYAISATLWLNSSENITKSPESIVQAQLEAYNTRNIDLFCSYFSQEAQIINLPDGKITTSGLAEIRKSYADLFSTCPKLKCTITNRITHGNYVIDNEVASGIIRNDIKCVAVYLVENNKITKVWFLN